MISEFESRDDRVVRRWREAMLLADPPAAATPEEQAWVESQMAAFRAKPYVHRDEDVIYHDEEDTYPWERQGWDAKAAMHTGYVPPPELDNLAEPCVEVGQTFSEMFGALSADRALDPSDDIPPSKADPSWVEPTPADKARVTAWVAADFSVADMAKLLGIGEEQFRWSFHDTLQMAALEMKARLAIAMFTQAISEPGSARNRVARFMGVFDHTKPPRPAPGSERQPAAQRSHTSALGAQRVVRRQRPRFGGAPPKPGPDGAIAIEMVLGDSAMQTRLDAAQQRRAREVELLLDLRASRGQDRDGRPFKAA